MRIHFPNLNSIRFIAAFLVLYTHFEQNKAFLGINHYFDSVYCKLLATIGLNSFFVLSGFLISYLLIAEINESNQISLKNFYIKRVLRIWPLYYLIIILALFVFPFVPFFQIPYFSDLLLQHWLFCLPFLILILPNLVSAVIGVIPFATQAWSIGSEEQFYLFWPLFVKKCHTRFVSASLWLIAFFAVTTIGFDIVKESVRTMVSPTTFRLLDSFGSFYVSSRISVFCIGGLGAYLFIAKSGVLKIIYHPFTQIASFFLLVISYGFQFHPPYLLNEYYALLIVIILVNLATNEKSLINIEHPVLDYLGKISYGLYMYHNMMLFISIKLVGQIVSFEEFGLVSNVASFLLGLIGTIVLSHLSFRYFESKFLRLKSKLIT